MDGENISFYTTTISSDRFLSLKERKKGSNSPSLLGNSEDDAFAMLTSSIPYLIPNYNNSGSNNNRNDHLQKSESYSTAIVVDLNGVERKIAHSYREAKKQSRLGKERADSTISQTSSTDFGESGSDSDSDSDEGGSTILPTSRSRSNSKGKTNDNNNNINSDNKKDTLRSGKKKTGTFTDKDDMTKFNSWSKSNPYTLSHSNKPDDLQKQQSSSSISTQQDLMGHNSISAPASPSGLANPAPNTHPLSIRAMTMRAAAKKKDRQSKREPNKHDSNSSSGDSTEGNGNSNSNSNSSFSDKPFDSGSLRNWKHKSSIFKNKEDITNYYIGASSSNLTGNTKSEGKNRTLSRSGSNASEASVESNTTNESNEGEEGDDQLHPSIDSYDPTISKVYIYGDSVRMHPSVTNWLAVKGMIAFYTRRYHPIL